MNEAGAPAAAIDIDGNVHVVWVQSDGVSESIYHSQLQQSATTWSSPQLIEAVAGISHSPDIATSGNLVMVVWSRMDYTGDIYPDIYSNEYAPNTGWGEEVIVTDLSRSLPLIDMDDQGGTMLLFHNYHTTYSAKEMSAEWSATAHVTPYNNGEQHFFDINGNGIGAAVWTSPNGVVDDLKLAINK